MASPMKTTSIDDSTSAGLRLLQATEIRWFRPPFEQPAQLRRAMLVSVPRQDAAARGRPDAQRLRFGETAERGHDIIARCHAQHFAARLEELLDALPRVANEARTRTCRLEYASRWRVADT